MAQTPTLIEIPDLPHHHDSSSSLGKQGCLFLMNTEGVPCGVTRTYRESQSQLVECPNCSHCMFLEEPHAEDLAYFYAHEMGRSYEKDFASSSREDVRTLFAKVQSLTNIAKMKIHDDGCGSGYIVHFLNEAGIDASGTDVSETTIAYGISKGASDLGVGSAEHYLQSRARTPNIIFLQHTLEHLHQPVGYLETLLGLLDWGGSLVLFVPNRNYLPIRQQGFSEDPAFIYPMHLNYFTPESLRCVLSTAGFTVTHLEATTNFGFAINMEESFLQALAVSHPDWNVLPNDERLQKAKDAFMTYELFCIAKADWRKQLQMKLALLPKGLLRRLGHLFGWQH